MGKAVTGTVCPSVQSELLADDQVLANEAVGRKVINRNQLLLGPPSRSPSSLSQLVICPMSIVAQQNRKSPLSYGHFQPNQDFYQQCYEAKNLQTWCVSPLFFQGIFDGKCTCTEFPIFATNHNSFH